ncbi:MAG TPA: 8-amino-7-oxononanoate synthase [Sandaracinaceae bacterium LLY-WYZ-13_1]|nr:8-amino-7-oxononanoate synthase [Sandaracinaceae bacterium LLY-WYZ-13_1]
MSFDEAIEESLRELAEAGLLRRPPELRRLDPVRVAVDGTPALLFCSNDYLGLSDHPALLDATRRALDEHGLGSGASRLISGTRTPHRAAERALAALVRRPSALLFSTGYAANLGALSALVGRHDVAFSDRLNHASLIDGLRLARPAVHVYAHADVDDLARRLEAHRADGREALVVTDTVFSMDGDVAPLRRLRALCDRYDAGLYVDEAHALGVLGEGRGACHAASVVPDALVGTLGKAAGVAGAFVAGSASLRTLLENRARSYVFSTAPPAALAAAAEAAADLLDAADDRRARVLGYAATLRDALRHQGWEVPRGETPIVPVLVGDAERTMALSAALLERGFYVRGIRPPTVPSGTSRLRVVPTAGHSEAHLRALIDAFAELGP